MDRLTVPVAQPASAPTAPVTRWSTGVVTEATGVVVLVTGVVGICLTNGEVDLTTGETTLTTGEAGRADLVAGTTDAARPESGEEGLVTGAASAEPANTVERTNAKNMPAKMATMTIAGRRILWSGTGGTMSGGSPDRSSTHPWARPVIYHIQCWIKHSLQ